MPTEDDLRELLRAQAAPNRLDAKQVVRASRRRRIPQQIAAGSVGALAIAGIAVFGIQTTQFGQGGQAESMSAPYVAEDSSGDGGAADSELSMKQLAAEQINRCGAPLTDTVPSATGLVLEVVDPLTATAGPGPITATVRMTNTGTEPVAGSTFGSPALTLSRDGIVLWHSNGATEALDVVVDLAPGQSIDYTTTFVAVECAAEDEDRGEFRTDLPALPPGAYDLSALFYFDSGAPRQTTELDLISGPLAPITLQ